MTEKQEDLGALADFRRIVSHQYDAVMKKANAATGKYLSFYTQ